MERWKQLGKYQKAVLIFITAMSLMFVIVYSVTIHREGFAYQKNILVPSEENGSTMYSGKIKGEQARFTVSADKVVEFQHGDKIYGPALTHKGEWYAWFCGVVVCFVTAISILFADELFRFNMAFQIRDAETAEPSEWQIAGRYISWTILPLMAMIIFIMGLQ